MKLNIALAGALVVALALPAVAQTTSFYVVQDAKTKKCTIIDKKPTATEYTTVGEDGVVYKTRNRGRDRDENRQGLHDRIKISVPPILMQNAAPRGGVFLAGYRSA